MNYFEKMEKIDRKIGVLKADFPHLYDLLFDYVERIAMAEDAREEIDTPNAFHADFAGTRSLLNYKFLIKTLTYYFTFVQKGAGRSLLLSYNLAQRFSKLTERLVHRERCLILATKTNIKFARQAKGAQIIKCDSVFYSRSIERGLQHLLAMVKHEKIDPKVSGVFLGDLERELSSQTDKLAKILKNNNVTQYITPFAGRYEEILLGLACKKAGVLSKEICHGVNSHTLAMSDNVVPTFFDNFYVWNRQYYQGISAFPQMERVKICGYPKFSADEIREFRRKYQGRRLITYFSQPTYDVGSRTSEPVDEGFLAEESIWRKQWMAVLAELQREHGFEVRLRYHRGEVSANDCDRAAERRNALELGFEISTNPLEKDICESLVCIGVNTSVLYEAFVMGQNVFQVYFSRTGQGNYHNTIPVLPCEKLKENILQLSPSQEGPKEPLLMDLDWFLAER